MPAWLDYQKLAAHIYADLSGKAEVTHDDHIPGKDTGISRQIDVSIRSSIAGHGILIAVQAKDLAKPADVNVVGEFLSVLKDIRANKGVLICSSGFTETALVYAKTLGVVDLCTAHDAQSQKWGISLKIPLLWIEDSIEVGVNLNLRPNKPAPGDMSMPANPLDWKVAGADLPLASTVRSFLTAHWKAGAFNQSREEKHECEFETPGIRVLMSPDFECPLERITVTYQITRTAWLGSFSFADCTAIVNQSEGTLSARVGFRLEHLPKQRDPQWPKVDDPQKFEKEAANLVVLEHGVSGPADWNSPDMRIRTIER